MVFVSNVILLKIHKQTTSLSMKEITLLVALNVCFGHVIRQADDTLFGD